MSLELHKATPDDLPGLQRILEEARAYKVSLGDFTWGKEPYEEDEVAEIISDGETFIGYIDSEPAATFSLTWEDRHTWGDEIGKDGTAGYIHSLVTSDQFRGQHVGVDAMNWAATQITGQGRKVMRLDCSIDNRKLCEYYESQGFKLVGTRKLNNHYTAALYEKTV
jgi:ribosomal protein S18 acetylase RimI-like enzyme